MSEHQDFRRLIVALGHTDADPAMLRAAAEFAHLLGLHLHWVFVEDEAVLTWAELPFAREFRLPTHDWAPPATDRMAEELRHAAAQARRLVDQAVGTLDISAVFEVLRGDPATCIGGLCSTTDIVLVTRPAGSAAASAVAALRLEEAARTTPAAVLLLPSDLALRRGPVVAVLRDQNDPSLAVAAQIARTGNNDLLLVLPAAAAVAARERAATLGLAQAHVVTRAVADFAADAVLAALAGTRERLIVITRDSGPGSAAGATRLVAERGVPVLVTEPPG